MLKCFEERPCPFCSSQSHDILFSQSMSKVFKANPTYNKDWFNENSIPPDYEFPFVKCKTCGFVFSVFKAKDDIAFRYYNESINMQKSKEKIFKKEKRTSLIEIWRKLNLLSEKKDYVKILDFGAGWGDFLAIAKSPGVEVFGLEFDERKIEFAQSQGIPIGNMEFIRMNAPYDIVMCHQVLEHLDQPREALKELRSLVNANAVGFISVPNFDDSILNEQVGLIKQGMLASKNIDPMGHLNYFTPYTLRQMVFESGFEEIKSEKPAKGFFSKTCSIIRKNKVDKINTSIFVRTKEGGLVNSYFTRHEWIVNKFITKK
jgi:2-polyprenyl-3-methyl-5-hydroxy-6-metoxy-1,4-benzoquinol methylase